MTKSTRKTSETPALGTVEYLGGSKIKLTWACGHTETETLKDPDGKNLWVHSVKWLVKYWTKNTLYLPACTVC